MIIKRIKKLLQKRNQKKMFKRCLIKSESSFLLGNTSLDFRVGHDDRIYVEIGERSLITAKFIFESTSGFVKIGNNVHLGGVNFICRSAIIIENDVTMAWGITIYDHNSHSVDWEFRMNDNFNCYEDFLKYNGNNIINKDWSKVISKPITICSKVWIGFDVTILKGVTIGEGAIVAAKSVVTKDVEPWTVVAGNPAVFRKKINNSFL